MATGNITFGQDYFPHPRDENKIWRKLKQSKRIKVIALLHPKLFNEQLLNISQSEIGL